MNATWLVALNPAFFGSLLAGVWASVNGFETVALVVAAISLAAALALFRRLGRS